MLLSGRHSEGKTGKKKINVHKLGTAVRLAASLLYLQQVLLRCQVIQGLIGNPKQSTPSVKRDEKI